MRLPPKGSPLTLPAAPDAAAASADASGAEEKEETCGFCRFMKAGPCGSVFSAWEACVDANREGGTDAFVESCMAQTRGLKECMEANPEYYGPMLEGGDDGDEAAAEGGDAATDDRVEEAAPGRAAEHAVPAAEAAPAASAKEAAAHRH